MRSTLIIFVILSSLATAYAGSIDLYLTKGADWQYINTADRFNSNEKTFAFVSGSPNPATLSHGPFTQVRGTTETYYVWTDFTNFPDNGNGSLQIWGYGLSGSYASGNAATDGCWYRHRQGATYRRWTWDSAYGPMVFPGGAVAVQSQGITAPSSADLQMNVGGVSHALLAVFQFISGASPADGKFYLGPIQELFLAVREYDADGSLIHDWDTGEGGYYPNFTVMGQPYTHPDSRPLLAIATVPEPASLGLIGLVALILRRR